ncbi:hypothetical protein TNCV_386691 [Trichonephila clavipes]|nr:hypothetical protein TNCV_386691 [Trichonephila clavipes]
MMHQVLSSVLKVWNIIMYVKRTPIIPNAKILLIGLIFHTVNVISFSAKMMNLWWLNLVLLSSGVIKATEPTTEDASDTDDAENDIIINIINSQKRRIIMEKIPMDRQSYLVLALHKQNSAQR